MGERLYVLLEANLRVLLRTAAQAERGEMMSG